MRPRLHEAELLDATSHDLDELAHSLAQVAAVNRWLGGVRGLVRHLRPLLALRAPRLLDVGTGDGATLREIVQWAAARGRRWRAAGLDHHPDVIAVAGRSATVSLVRADALALPFPDRSFDAVFCSLFLHHFEDTEAERVLREMARVSRGLVLVSDLERSTLHHLGARILAGTVWRRNRLTRHDGPLSVLRAFTREELAGLGQAAGLRRPQVRRYTPWRLVLEGRA